MSEGTVAPLLAAEERLLGPFLDAYAAHFGTRPLVRPDAFGATLTFPAGGSPLFEQTIGRVGVFGSHRPVLEHLTRLGFAWDKTGFLLTIPTPMSLRARMVAAGFERSGYEPRYYQNTSPLFSARPWVSAFCQGFVPFAVGTRSYYRALRWMVAASPVMVPWRNAVASLLSVHHDMTKHALLTHLIPGSEVRHIGQRVEEVIGAWGPIAEPIVQFFEGELLGYCQAIWRDLQAPEDFAPTFLAPANLGQFHALLERRLREGRRWRPGARVEAEGHRISITRPTTTGVLRRGRG